MRRWFYIAFVVVCSVEIAEMGVTKGGLIITQMQNIEDLEPLKGPECLANSTWSSQCHECHCTKKGRPVCEKSSQYASSDEKCRSQLAIEMRCAPGTTWQNECNHCDCNGKGQSTCTNMKCTMATTVPPEATNALPTGKMCALGTVWSSKCYKCNCDSDGNSNCTNVCPDLSNVKPPQCAPRSSWQYDCNTCWCVNDRPQCTRIGCDVPTVELHFDDDDSAANGTATQLRFVDHNIVKREVCKPNQTFKNECNTCQCNSDGQKFSCTRGECMDAVDKDVEVFMETEGVDHIERHSVCQPGSTFYVGCNTCVCNAVGTDYACTNNQCPVPDDVELFHELKDNRSSFNKTIICSANRMFIKDCNTCWCNDDGTSFVCTRKVCVPNLADDTATDEPEMLRIIKKKCRPDEVFEVDCNMCRCNPDGESYSCTRRACFTDPPTEPSKYEAKIPNQSRARKARATQTQEAPKACTPGQEFRMDCNTCLCDNEGQDFSCTRIDCNNNNKPSRRKREVAKREMTQCEPGAVFQQECNVCRCSGDGRHATCTLKRCDTRSEDTTDVTSVESDSSFRCNPGEQFKRGCNDCSCSADGKSVFCTIRLCDTDINNL